jgi:hypothetical protein
MTDTLDLTQFAATIDTAAERGHAFTLGYIDDDGYPAVSFRGSTHVHGPEQLAIWVRKVDDGFVKAIAGRPQVTLLYYGRGGPDPMYLSIRGRARVDPSVNDAVYKKIIEGERGQDPEQKGVAVVIDVESVRGFAATGAFQLTAAGAAVGG